MKYPGYKQAIEWIALNDSAGDDDALNPEIVSGLVTSVMVAELFDVDSLRVGEDIVKYRRKHVDLKE